MSCYGMDGFEPATYECLHVPLQSTALPTELPEDGGIKSETGFSGLGGCLAGPTLGVTTFHFVASLSTSTTRAPALTD